jgi:hypothetical protein
MTAFIRLLIHPKQYALAIAREQLGLKRALFYLGLALGVELLINAQFALYENTLFANFEPFNEIVLLLFYLSALIINSGFSYLALKIFGGTGSFKKTCIAQMMLMVIFISVTTISDFIAVLLHNETDKLIITQLDVLSYFYALPLLDIVHGISQKRVALALCCIYFIALVIVAFIAYLGIIELSGHC